MMAHFGRCLNSQRRGIFGTKGSADENSTTSKPIELVPIISAPAEEEGNGLDIEATGPTNDVSYRAKIAGPLKPESTTPKTGETSHSSQAAEC